MTKPGRRPVVGTSPRPRKQPSTGGIAPETTDEQAMRWALAHVDLDGKWGWSHLDRASMARLHVELLAYEETATRKLRIEDKLNDIPVDDLCEAAKQRLIALGLEDDDPIWELRLGYRKWRVWGIRRGTTFYLLWWDPKHSVCRGRDRARARGRR